MKWINRGRKKNSKSKYIIEQNSFNINHRRHLMTRDGASIEWPNLSLRNILSPTCLISIYPRPSIEFYQILVDKCGSRCLLYSRSTSLLPRSNSQIHLPYRRSVREILAGISIRWMRLQKLAPCFTSSPEARTATRSGRCIYFSTVPGTHGIPLSPRAKSIFLEREDTRIGMHKCIRWTNTTIHFIRLSFKKWFLPEHLKFLKRVSFPFHPFLLANRSPRLEIA